MAKYLNAWGNKLKPHEVNEALEEVVTEADGTAEAVAELETLIGATPLETGKTVTSELADHETRVTALESGDINYFDIALTENIGLSTDSDGNLIIAETSPLYGKTVIYGRGLTADNVQFELFKERTAVNVVKASDQTKVASKTLSYGIVIYI